LAVLSSSVDTAASLRMPAMMCPTVAAKVTCRWRAIACRKGPSSWPMVRRKALTGWYL
jgi:hypothetical protein